MSVNRYRRLESLGRGGQGHTFVAIDSDTGQRVALKEISLKQSDWKTFDLFERECQVLRALDHSGIPRYLDAFAVEDEGRYVLVMELVEGSSLQQQLDEHHLFSEGELFLVLHQTLDILEYLHGLHPAVIHRDVKPANLVRRPDNRLALVDFGGVRRALAPEGGSTVIGTFGYMAPEQLHGEANPATDIYGLGATLAALACGKGADKLPRRGLAIDLELALPSGPLRTLLSAMLCPEPQGRLSSVAAVRHALLKSSPGQRKGRRRRAAATPQPPPPPAPIATSDKPHDEAERDELADGTAPAILRVAGHLGVAALTLLEVVLLPLIFALLVASWGKTGERKAKLRGTRQSIRKGLRTGRRKLRRLAAGTLDEGSRQLPPSRAPQARGQRPHRPPRRDRCGPRHRR
jgi:serine/threonine protein kinase